MTNKRALLLDCDGTLVDSEKIAMGVAIDVLADAVEAQKNVPALDRPRLVQEFAGWHFHKMIGEMEQRYGVALDREALDALKIPATLDGLKKVKICGGMERVLENAVDQHRPIAVVTSSEFSRVNLCLDVTGLSRFFPENLKFSANDTLPEPRHKPDPAIYLYSLEKLEITADEAIAVEDSKSGAEAAARAGIDTIGYVGASHIPDNGKEAAAKVLLEKGAKVIISHHDDLEAAMNFIETGTMDAPFRHRVYFPEAGVTPASVPPPRAPTPMST